MLVLAAALLAAPCNADPAYAVRSNPSPVRVAARAGKFVASARVDFSVQQITPALVPSADSGLLDHVHGHLIVAQRVVRSAAASIQANGATAAQAKAHLLQTVTRMRRDLQAELNREERVYDTVTANGAQQSQGPAFGFPGGADAHTPCTQPGR